jgi:hypothetical protein
MERCCRSYSATGAKYVTRNAINDGVVGLARSCRVSEQGQGLAELLKGAGSNSSQPGASTQQGPLGGLLGSLSAAVAGGGVGGLLGGGLGELLDRFKQKATRRNLGSIKVPIKNYPHPS